MKPLTIYKASAGSGKTFTLATEYIKLVVSDPSCYRNILAVTFTNKATEEMKMRILTHLYGIWKQLPESKDYLDKVKEGIDMSEEQTMQNAGKALHNLIHNYNYFRVETIDRFFQSVLRNLARELDLTANLRISLNDKQVEQMAVDELIEELDSNNRLLGWIIEYIRDNIDEDKGWNVISKIKKFGENIFKDEYKDNCKQLNLVLDNDEFFKKYSTRLKNMKRDAEKELAECAESFFKTLESNSLTIDDFVYGKKGVCGYFIKLRNGVYTADDLVGSRVRAGMDDGKNWVAKAAAKEGNLAYDLACSQLKRMLNETEDKRKRLAPIMRSVDLTLKHIYQLRMLKSIDEKVKEMNEEENRFMLSDTQGMLAALIEEQDSPFIYEKIGTQLNHIMIDEFQDTSTVQWKNFKVLLSETMSRAEEKQTVYIGDKTVETEHLVNNMVVGDVKQSIYRWRAGDWRLLNNIEGEFDKDAVFNEHLKTNYRSFRNVVEFNNAFFTEIADKEYEMLKKAAGDNKETLTEVEQLKKAYSDVTQNVPKSKKPMGEISIELLVAKKDSQTKEATDDEDDGTSQTDMLEHTLDTLKYLIDNGASQKDIAIIVRNNKDIKSIADYIMQQDNSIRIVSEEAFQLDASPAVNIIIAALRHLSHPDDLLAKAQLLKLASCDGGNGDMDDSDFIIPADSNGDRCKDAFDNLLPKKLVNNRRQLLNMPLFELVEKIYGIFGLSKIGGQSAYLCAFYDKLNEYMQDNLPDIEMFLNEWDENLHQQTIQTDAIDGVRLLTIHKSKGLEFDNVIVPFCNWKLEMGGTVWCKPEEAPFDALPLVPVDFSANQMTETIYEGDYMHEHLQNMVDNLNLLYVAFTRAGKNLYVIGQRSSADSMKKGIPGAYRSWMIEWCITDVAKKLRASGHDVELSGIKESNVDSATQPTEGGGKKKGKKKKEEAAPLEDITFKMGHFALDSKDKSDKKTESYNECQKTANVFKTDEMPCDFVIDNYDCHIEFRQSNKSRDFIAQDDEDHKRKSQYIEEGNILHSVFSRIHTVDDIEPVLHDMEMEGVIGNGNMTAEKVMSLIDKGLENETVRGWFSPGWQLYNECTILNADAEGNELRPDRVMRRGDEVVVVDYKFGQGHNSNPQQMEKYQRQVHGYTELLKEMGYCNVKGYLWFVKCNEIIEVK